MNTKNNPSPDTTQYHILAIDTSCDDTSIAIINQHGQIVSNIVSSQIELHRPYGGVFPTVAKLAHQQNIDHCLELALKRAHLDWSQIKAIAVTQGPGLAPALEVGIRRAIEIAQEYQLPLFPINHVEAHAWSSQIKNLQHQDNQAIIEKSDEIVFPILSLVISGGHSEFILIKNPGEYEILGETLDDAAGECLDKIGRLLNLGYPAGPTLEKLAKLGNPLRFSFPLPLTSHHDFNLSFSGLKTHARHQINQLKATLPNETLDLQMIYDYAASTQAGVFKHITYKLNKLLLHLYQNNESKHQFPSQIWLGGGVAANIYFRSQIRALCRNFSQKNDLNSPLLVKVPPKINYCGDNAAMIALIALLKYQTAEEKLAISPQVLQREPNLTVTSWI